MEQPDSREEDRIAAIEHRDVLLAIQAILPTASGKILFKYLFNSLGVGELPEFGLEGSLLMGKLGHLRAGHSVFKIVAQANPDIAGQLLAENERDKHVKFNSDI